ncbi:MAG: type III-A CRISPR-associated protein Cas10/Csm1 [Moorellaceae bacterium]
MKRETVVLAGLLHDIGKIIYWALRPQERWGRNHQELGFAWARERGLPVEVQEAIRCHHVVQADDIECGPAECRNLIYLIAEADNLAVGAGRPEGSRESNYESDQGLGLIFDRVGLGAEKGQQHVWQPELLEEAPYPLTEGSDVKQHTADLYRSAWAGLYRSLQDSHNLQEDRLLLLLEKYLSIVPEYLPDSAAFPADTSLYHHLRVTAAIGGCNYLYLTESGYNWEEDLKKAITDRREMRYLLVGAEVSGLQDFIFTVRSKTAFKTVQARAFFADLLVESAASQLLTELCLGRSSLIYASGGKFYLLAPNISTCRKRLEVFRDGFNFWLYDNFGTGLYLCVASVPLSGAELKEGNAGLRKAWEELHRNLYFQDQKKWETLLCTDPVRFLEPRPVDRECQVCHCSSGVKKVDLDGVSLELCTFCHFTLHLGERLASLKSFYEVEPEGREHSSSLEQIKLTLYGSAYLFGDSVPEGVKVEYRLKKPWELPSSAWPVRTFFSGASYSQTDFEELACQAVGDKKIAALRMDVDRVGEILSYELERPNLARMSELSAKLNLYFKYYLPRLLERATGGFLPVKPRKLPVQVVYTGGQGLFLVGTWDGVVEAAMAINLDFQKYTGHNASFTLSGGLVISDARLNLYRLAKLATFAKDEAQARGGNRLSVLGTVLTWEEVARLRQYFEMFRPALEQVGLTVRPKEFSYGFFRRFSGLVEEYNRESTRVAQGLRHSKGEGNGNRKWVLPQLYYLFTKARAGKKREGSREFYRKLLAVSLSDDALTIFLPPVLRALQLILQEARDGASA